MKAILIPVEGEPREVEQNGLEDLQQLVEGLIDAVDFPDRPDLTVYINDEGKHVLERNRTATGLLREGLFSGDWIAGPCALAGFDPSRRETLPVPEDAMALVRAAATQVTQEFGPSLGAVPDEGASDRPGEAVSDRPGQAPREPRTEGSQTTDNPITVKAQGLRRTDIAWHRNREQFAVVSTVTAWPERGEVEVCFLYEGGEVAQVFGLDEEVPLEAAGINAQRIIDRLCVPEGEKASAWETKRYEDHMFHAGFYPVGNGHEFVAALGAWENGGHIRLLPDGGEFPYSFSLAADAELAIIDYCEGDIGVRVYREKETYIRALDLYVRGSLDSEARRREHERLVARALRTRTFPGTVEFESR